MENTTSPNFFIIKKDSSQQLSNFGAFSLTSCGLKNQTFWPSGKLNLLSFLVMDFQRFNFQLFPNSAMNFIELSFQITNPEL